MRTGANVDLRRAIGARTSLVADAGYDEFGFEGPFGRDDKRWTFGIGLEHSLLPRLTVGLTYRYEDRESDLELFNYASNVVLLTFTLAPPD